MMNSIPCMIMRGGSSRGPFIHMADLPESVEARSEVLLDLMGSGHPLQVDGIGGGNSLTSKVAIVGRSSRRDAAISPMIDIRRPPYRARPDRPHSSNRDRRATAPRAASEKISSDWRATAADDIGAPIDSVG